jgi:hypothetical protein
VKAARRAGTCHRPADSGTAGSGVCGDRATAPWRGVGPGFDHGDAKVSRGLRHGGANLHAQDGVLGGALAAQDRAAEDSR